MRPLKIHTDPSLILPNAGIHWLVRPLLDRSLADAALKAPDASQFRPFDRILFEYNKIANSLFTLSTLEECDLAVVPVNWEELRGGSEWFARSDRHWIGLIEKFAERARSLGKPVLIFFSEDRSHEPVPIDGAVVARHAMYRTRKTALDLSMPVLIYADLVAGENAVEARAPREWRQTPVIGFCGFSRQVTMPERLKAQLVYKPYMLAKFGHPDVSPFVGIRLRDDGLRYLQGDTRIETNFIIRNRSVFLTGEDSQKAGKDRARREYLQNMLDSDYQFCVRGSANFSRRPWETLCCSRFPLFVDTDCVLPFEDYIDWSKYMPLVAERDLPRMAELLNDFHTGIRPDDYLQRQEQARSLWETWLTPHGFASQLQRNFGKMILRCYQPAVRNRG